MQRDPKCTSREPRRVAGGRLRVLFTTLLLLPGPGVAGSDESMLDRLREGGLVIVLSAAEHGPGSVAYRPMPECAPGTRLTETGWQDALAIGVGLRKQRVFVERAQAGPGCAARHTAYLVFGADRVRHDPDLVASCLADAAQRRARRVALANRLAEIPPYPRSNLAVIVAGCNLHDLAEPTWPECARAPRAGDAVLFDPQRGNAIVGCLARETLHAWSRLPQ